MKISTKKHYIIMMLTIFSTSVLANGLTSVWDTDWNEMTLIQSGSTVNGKYLHSGGEVTGQLTQTPNGLLLKGWWRETDNDKSCGENNAWSGPLVFLFDTTQKTFTGDWGYCSTDPNTLDPAKKSWTGTLRSGAIDASLAGGTTSADDCIAVLRSDGQLHIPCVAVPNGFGGTILFKADLRLIPFSNPITFEVTGASAK